MDIPFQYLVRKDDPTVYRTSGMTALSQTGFDPEIYEVVVPEDGQLPEGMQKEKRPYQVIQEIRNSMLADYQAAPVVLRAQFATMMAAVNASMDLGDFEVAGHLVQEAEVSEETIPNPELRAIAEAIKINLLSAVELLGGLAV